MAGNIRNVPNAYIPPYSSAFTAPLTYRQTDIQRMVYRVSQYGLTKYDACLARELGIWNEIIEAGGLQTICVPVGRPKYANRPWIVMPAEGRRFKPIAILALTDPSVVFDGSNIVVPFTTIQNLFCPLGYDGVITDVIMNVLPGASGVDGFVEGSGDITWRLQIQQRYARDYGNIMAQVGSLTSPSPVPRGGIRVRSRDQVQFLVALSAAAQGNLSPDDRIVCSLSGWWYPR